MDSVETVVPQLGLVRMTDTGNFVSRTPLSFFVCLQSRPWIRLAQLTPPHLLQGGYPWSKAEGTVPLL